MSELWELMALFCRCKFAATKRNRERLLDISAVSPGLSRGSFIRVVEVRIRTAS
jgi:hypothetical protein